MGFIVAPRAEGASCQKNEGSLAWPLCPWPPWLFLPPTTTRANATAPISLSVHPGKSGGKLDQCALCHSGGALEKNGTRVVLGSCQWCHFKYGYDQKGPLSETLNSYGRDYLKAGRDRAAIAALAGVDSDNDGFCNQDEIAADRFPGNADDDPKKSAAPTRVYTRAQLEALPQHTQFLLQNAAKSEDAYAEFSGVTMETLLRDAGILDSATGITVFSPDGWSQYHPLRPIDDPAMYPVYGAYPAAVYQYSPQASFCDTSAASCSGREPGSAIKVRGGLRMLLALKREGVPLGAAALSKDNKLDGEGPYRVIVPQKVPSPPDRPASPRSDPGHGRIGPTGTTTPARRPAPPPWYVSNPCRRALPTSISRKRAGNTSTRGRSSSMAPSATPKRNPSRRQRRAGAGVRMATADLRPYS